MTLQTLALIQNSGYWYSCLCGLPLLLQWGSCTRELFFSYPCIPITHLACISRRCAHWALRCHSYLGTLNMLLGKPNIGQKVWKLWIMAFQSVLALLIIDPVLKCAPMSQWYMSCKISGGEKWFYYIFICCRDGTTFTASVLNSSEVCLLEKCEDLPNPSPRRAWRLKGATCLDISKQATGMNWGEHWKVRQTLPN